jgi:hypothetical protein
MLQTVFKQAYDRMILWWMCMISVPRVGNINGDPYHGVNANVKGKGKAIPLQSWTGTEGSRRLRLPDVKTFST